MNYWNKYCECMEREELEKLQSERLIEAVERVYYNVPYYRNLMQEKGLMPEDIKGREDLNKLPFTTKDDLRENYPYGFFAVPLSEIVRIHASSGTTGKPTVVGYTRRDISIWSELMARTLTCGGATKDSVIQVAYGYGLFTGGLGVHYGAERLGASVIPISGGNTKRQIMLMKDFGTTVLACTPSYVLYMLFPNAQNLRPDITSNDIFTRMVKHIYETDTNTNVAPSIHVLNSIGVHIALVNCEEFKKQSRIWHWLSLISAVLICLSTVFIKQHSIKDGMWAMLLVMVLYLAIYTVPRYFAEENIFATDTNR
jgi:hypothetical protein